MTLLDLFSGIGGFSYAAELAGFKTIGFSEIDPFCNAILRKQWPDVPNYGNISNLNFKGHVTLITGGFPCQPFSVAGKRKGEQDARYLWPEFFRIIRDVKPHWVVGENVNGIVGMELDNIIDDLESENYETRAFIIPACAAGAPHKRERVWIVAHRFSERCDVRASVREKRHVQGYFDRHLAALQSEWEKFKPQSWKAFNAQEWLESTPNATSQPCEQNDTASLQFSDRQKTRMGFSRENLFNKAASNWAEDQPPIPGVDDGLPNIVDRNKSLGNSIVPQVVFPILSTIAIIEKDLKNV